MQVNKGPFLLVIIHLPGGMVVRKIAVGPAAPGGEQAVPALTQIHLFGKPPPITRSL